MTEFSPMSRTFTTEDDLFEYLDRSLNANGLIPQMSGYDKDGQPFMAWLDEDGGDSVVMLVTRLTINDGGTTSLPVTEYVDQPIRTTDDAYPVSMFCLAVKA